MAGPTPSGYTQRYARALRPAWCVGRIVLAVSCVVGGTLAPSAAADQTGSYTSGSLTFPDITHSVQGTTAQPYPSNIAVSGLTGGVKKVTVTLNGLNSDGLTGQEYLLVSPSGKTTEFMSDAANWGTGPHSCSPSCQSPVDLTFDDQAASQLPSCIQVARDNISSGTYRPLPDHPPGPQTGTCDENPPAGGYGEYDFPLPAPGPPYGQTLSVHNGTNPNGTWSLYTFTDQTGQSTTQTSWTLTLTTPEPRLLTVLRSGSGAGTVTGPGISCPGACSKTYPDGTMLALTATPSAGSVFAGWGGACRGRSSCQLAMSAPESVTARFDRLSPPDTKITKAKINAKKRAAKFSFKAVGTASGLQCALVKKKKGKKHPKPAFASCSSPKTYKNLKSGRYRFLVRALNGAGPDPTPATKGFKI